MNSEDKTMLYVFGDILLLPLLVVIGIGIGAYIKSVNDHEIILECIKQAEIQNNPICSQYIKK